MSTEPARHPSGIESVIYQAPVVGRRLQGMREFYDDLRLSEDDPAGVAFGKNVLRYGTVVATGAAAAGIAAIVCL
jgi:hypothetical protein